MPVSSHLARWQSPEGEALAGAAARWLTSGGPRPSDLGEVDGRVDLRGLPLRGPGTVVSAGRRRRAPISPLTVVGGRWEGLDLTDALLAELRLTGTDIEDCLLDRADCSGWRLWRSEVSRSSFAGTDLTVAGLGTRDGDQPTRWLDVSFDGADLRSSAWQGAVAHGCSFRGARLDGVQFNQMDLADCAYAGTVTRVVFDGREVPGRPEPSPLVRLDFREARFEDTLFLGTHFVDATLPDDPDVHLVEDFPIRARAALAALADATDRDSRSARESLEERLSWPGADDSSFLFNRRDWGAAGAVVERVLLHG